MRKREMRRPAVAVIGCGVIGLTVAAELRHRWRTLRITIYAKDLDVRKTTSFVAAGKFEPSGICDEYETEDERQILADYLRRSCDRIVELHNSSSWHRTRPRMSCPSIGPASLARRSNVRFRGEADIRPAIGSKR
jgi:glycine/D-amino acid oxidase-like deaminating enzyme